MPGSLDALGFHGSIYFLQQGKWQAQFHLLLGLFPLVGQCGFCRRRYALENDSVDFLLFG